MKIPFLTPLLSFVRKRNAWRRMAKRCPAIKVMRNERFSFSDTEASKTRFRSLMTRTLETKWSDQEEQWLIALLMHICHSVTTKLRVAREAKGRAATFLPSVESIEQFFVGQEGRVRVLKDKSPAVPVRKA